MIRRTRIDLDLTSTVYKFFELRPAEGREQEKPEGFRLAMFRRAMFLRSGA
jgi:hypothetical protein